jgi:hypothetical protein
MRTRPNASPFALAALAVCFLFFAACGGRTRLELVLAERPEESTLPSPSAASDPAESAASDSSLSENWFAFLCSKAVRHTAERLKQTFRTAPLFAHVFP